MVDRDRFENIKEKLKAGRITFKEVCMGALRKDHMGQNDLTMLLLTAEDMAFPDGIYFIRNIEEIENMETSDIKASNQNMYERYEELMRDAYSKYLYLLCVFLKECARYQFTMDPFCESIFLEKGIGVCQEILFTLKKRSTQQARIGYIPSDILCLLVSIIRSHCKEMTPEFLSAVHEMKKLETEILELLSMKSVMVPLFKLFSCIIRCAEQKGEEVLQSLLKAIEKTETYKNSLYFGRYKSVPFLARALRDEIRAWGMSLVSPAYCYIDPAFPLLAGALVVKPEPMNISSSDDLSMHISMIIREMVRFTPYIDIRINYLYIDVGDIGGEITVHKWDYMCHVFNMDVITCEINFTTQNIYEASRFVDGLFRSIISQDIISLSMYPIIPLSKKAQTVLIENLHIQSLYLKELTTTDFVNSCIEEFVYALAKRRSGLLRCLKGLSITAPFHKSMVDSMQRITFNGIQELVLDFISLNSVYQMGRLKSITEIVNPTTFPILQELTVKNYLITRDDFNFLNLSMKLVQIKYYNFYCPSGSSYRPEQTSYIFKRPESVAMTSGIVFIVSESTVYEWTMNHSTAAFSDCLICNESFKDNPKEQVIILSCGSVVHITCIMEIFGKKKNPCCPFCKKKVHLIMGSPMAVDVMFKPPTACTAYKSLRQ
ncbi:hypothetical protein NEAUS04_2110 [Nematocida ausubeli]|uniref:RING-type domain-containing protein n=1 Tax=Nematocida ausubeli (strain ATCC PRA-371 / ERTm2) TaxID=1913371 RepID=A0A086J0I5_NEMA1|nr:uncharacterized protein NESG_01631 [Nematocida ausubeli]KAI5135810.1 hypothetical protein NEAUS06_1660 [Nematocida ausubeli]KAI5136241.1 hypothetical protein NEAUS07_1541 [Nematocida ausubeli]KAI5150392.1 hypothetical protein NEAUS05_2154 [Nematocida ausubeli]KAI5163978.1 hypothetical protein NEAUS04_1863 [Nematocida ausubeli]KAI5164314.1 hypothetical protein NEAUS04_2110 [Nematocida ausubeli]